ncbi:MAG: sulfatase-like hydrolase/transferase [Kiritimatiellaeota bacterium]|nr:sulfatase-like hydrolase/transferase [Kiritimatiellota bacterium]
MKTLIRFLAALFLVPLAALHAADAPTKKPNIIFILADDLGIGNVSCYGADNFKTPNLDALAQSGLRFEHCYASPLCGPSRALLMTGRYAFHTGMTGQRPPASFKPANETMLPKVLKPAGYVTGMVGKWSQLPLEPSHWGFDEYLRFQGSGKYWNTQDKNKTYTVNGKETPLLDGEYLPDKMNNFVVDFITRHKNEPFYLYYSMSHVHISIMRTPDSAPDSKDLYYDNVAYMDKLVGKLLAELDRLKLRDNTLIVFAGDNGTAPMFAARSTIHGKAPSGCKGTMLECGALVPCIASWPGEIPAGKVSPSLIDFSDFLPTLAAVAGAKLPTGLTVDGKAFASQLCGKEAIWPRDWIFVQLDRHWYDRDTSWKLNESRELFDMRSAPFAETLVPVDKQDDAATTARKRLQAVLDQLNPAGGKVGPGGDSESEGPKKKGGKKGAKKKSENSNGPEE